MNHPLFEDYLAKHRDDSVEQTDSYKSIRSRDKSKVFNVSLFNEREREKQLINWHFAICISVIKYIVADDRKYTRYKCQFETDAENLFNTTNWASFTLNLTNTFSGMLFLMHLFIICNWFLCFFLTSKWILFIFLL